MTEKLIDIVRRLEEEYFSQEYLSQPDRHTPEFGILCEAIEEYVKNEFGRPPRVQCTVYIEREDGWKLNLLSKIAKDAEPLVESEGAGGGAGDGIGPNVTVRE